MRGYHHVGVLAALQQVGVSRSMGVVLRLAGKPLKVVAAAVALALGFSTGVGLGAADSASRADRAFTPSVTPAVLQASEQELPAWARALLQGGPIKPYTRGARVLALQRLLHAQGYSVALDGRFQASTRRALQAFQRRVGLPADGVARESTLQALVQWSWWYPVRSGDTLGDIARLYGTDVATLRRLNGLNSNRLTVGVRLLVPRAGSGGASGRWGRYVARPGDTLWSIARRFAVDVEDLQRFNGLVQPESLVAGQLLWLPVPVNPQRPAPVPAPTRNLLPRPARRAHATPRTLFDWPVRGEVTSGFGWRDSPFGSGREFHEGIDIAVPPGTPVRAAADGVVVQAGWMGAFGYGVVIRHADGMETMYGHNRRLTVRPGQPVRRGQVIAYSGSTGRSTGPHVDFRVRVNGRLVDPLTVLPR